MQKKHAQCRVASDGTEFGQPRISMLNQDIHKTNCCDRSIDQNMEEGVDPRILYESKDESGPKLGFSA